MSGRDTNLEDIESAVGPYVSELVAVINLQQPLSQLLESTQQQTIESMSFQHTSLAEIQHEMGIGSLFNTCINVKNDFHSKISTFDGLRFSAAGKEEPSEVSKRLTFYSRSVITEPRTVRYHNGRKPRWRGNALGNGVPRERDSTKLAKEIACTMENVIEQILHSDNADSVGLEVLKPESENGVLGTSQMVNKLPRQFF